MKNKNNKASKIIALIVVFCLIMNSILIFTLLFNMYIDYNKKVINATQQVIDRPEINTDSSDAINENESIESTKFDGTFWYDPKKQIRDVFNIEIPSSFVDSIEKSNNIESEYNTNPEEIFGSCTVELKEIINYDNVKELAIGMSEYYTSTSEYNLVKVNGIEWYYLKYEFLGEVETYITELNDSIYMYSYTIEKDANKEICENYKNKILNSISYK